MGAWVSTSNWVDASSATITASDGPGDLLPANLANRYAYRMWRDATLEEGDTDAWFKVDFGQAREVGCLVLLFPRSNLPGNYDAQPSFVSSDTVRHRLDLTTPDAGALLDTGVQASGVVTGLGYHVYKLSSPVTARYWRCDLDAISRAANGYVDICRAWAGPVLEPAIGVDYGATQLWDSGSQVARAARGVADFVDLRESLRSYTMTFSWLSAAERDTLDDFERIMTTAGQFVACRADLGLARGTMLARQQRSTGLQAVGAHLKHQKQFQIVESL